MASNGGREPSNPYGFNYGPMIVERVAHDDRIGWVVIVRSEDYSKQVQIRCSPGGRNWMVTERGL